MGAVRALSRLDTLMKDDSRDRAPELFVVGLSHFAAPVAVRERLSAGKSELGELAARARAEAGLDEAVLLSTCSRFELYAAAQDPAAAEAAVAAWLARRAGTPVEPYLYRRRGREALEHLFRVAAGLDSWIIGETEVLGQVKDAYAAACAAGAAARTLNIAFQRAVGAGKEVRAKTPIAQGINSIGGAAALLAQKVFGGDGARSVLIFGAGDMAKSAARHLMAKGAGSVRVANRTLERAVELARALGAEAASLDDGLRSLAGADAIIFSTSAAGFLVDRARVADAVRARGGRPLFLIDLGVPRNVDPEAAAVDGAYLYDLDDLKRMVASSRGVRKDAVAAAEGLVAEAAAACWSKLSGPCCPAAPGAAAAGGGA